MLEVLYSNVLYSKIIDTEVDPYRATDVFPKAWHVGLFKIAMECESLFLRVYFARILAWGSLYIPFHISM
jgi:hypothetical protein